ncbi:uncharacterized protein C8R40DRAFT_649365 [Lentinula edodes]|uniref:uncharacterized protein n=1 Tax=Lentinula edodes TaxID=5353 RepID=UPI001E8E61B7|nr:uncharacterized protein C8R40DRAFT_649365 [Lentinula edodes]KAH7870275.1 hypothetical protein C8R40DRAFT_649365 [Lentinula edodes]
MSPRRCIVQVLPDRSNPDSINKAVEGQFPAIFWSRYILRHTLNISNNNAYSHTPFAVFFLPSILHRPLHPKPKTKTTITHTPSPFPPSTNPDNSLQILESPCTLSISIRVFSFPNPTFHTYSPILNAFALVLVLGRVRFPTASIPPFKCGFLENWIRRIKPQTFEWDQSGGSCGPDEGDLVTSRYTNPYPHYTAPPGFPSSSTPTTTPSGHQRQPPKYTPEPEDNTRI